MSCSEFKITFFDLSKIDQVTCFLPSINNMMRQLLQKKVSDIAIIIVILINKVDWHLNLKFSGDFTQGIPNHG